MTNPKPYSNLNATLAIARASLRSILRSPSAVIFTLAFPLIFIVVFANVGGGAARVDVGVSQGADTLSPVYQALKRINIVHLRTGLNAAALKKNLEKGSLDVVIDIKKQNAQPPFLLNVKYTKASGEKGNIFRSLLNSILFQINTAMSRTPPAVVALKEETVSGREYKYIDFILPGQLGFSLLSTGVFGTAFVFLSLRQTLVIKRFFATPVKRYSIILGEMLARIVFGLTGALFIILIGHYAFGFTLVHGWVTVVNMLVLAFFGLLIFMGFGFTVSGLAKNESAVPPISNLITLPQFLLSGTFFSTSAFPKILQHVSDVLPLTHLNNAMRQVAFEGAGIADVGKELLILLAWGIAIYAVAIKTFKWEV